MNWKHVCAHMGLVEQPRIAAHVCRHLGHGAQVHWLAYLNESEGTHGNRKPVHVPNAT